MKHLLTTLFCTAALMLGSCNAPLIQEEAWCDLDAQSYKLLLQTANEQGAPWTAQPLDIAKHFFYLQGEGIKDHKVDVLLSGETAKVTILNMGSADDSIKDQAYELSLRNERGFWIITGLRQSFTCRENRGHAAWSCEQCK